MGGFVFRPIRLDHEWPKKKAPSGRHRKGQKRKASGPSRCGGNGYDDCDCGVSSVVKRFKSRTGELHEQGYIGVNLPGLVKFVGYSA
jgi:hypothetical protein